MDSLSCWSFRFFQKAALHVLTLLDPAQPVLTLSLWRRACEMNVGATYDIVQLLCFCDRCRQHGESGRISFSD